MRRLNVRGTPLAEATNCPPRRGLAVAVVDAESGDGQPRTSKAMTARTEIVTRTPVKRGEGRVISSYPGQLLGRSKSPCRFQHIQFANFACSLHGRRTAKRLPPVRYRPRFADPSIVRSKSNAISKLKAGIQCASLVG